MLELSVILGVLVFALLALTAKNLLTSALFLGVTSALLSVSLYLLESPQVAVIELSVGAGLVTVLFAFALSIAGREAEEDSPLVPIGLLMWVVTLILIIAGATLWPWKTLMEVKPEPSLGIYLWDRRGLDLIVQIVLIFAGVLGLLGLLAEAKAPLRYPMADEYIRQRQEELQTLEEQSLQEELV